MNAWKENGNRNQYAELMKQYEQDKNVWDIEHPKKDGLFQSLSLVDIAMMPTKPSRVSYNDVGISLHVYGLYNTYDIEWDDVGRSLKGLLNWVQTITTKRWSDSCLVHDFIECVSKHFNHKIFEYD